MGVPTGTEEYMVERTGGSVLHLRLAATGGEGKSWNLTQSSEKKSRTFSERPR